MLRNKICICVFSVCAVITLLSSTTVASPSAWASANAPVWSIGDWWEYEYTLIMEDRDTGEKVWVNGTRNYSVESVLTINVNGTDYDVYENVMVDSGTIEGMTQYGEVIGTLDRNGTDYLVQTNYSVVKIYEEMYVDMQVGGYPWWIDEWHAENYTPPEDAFNFPIDIGETWYAECVVTRISFTKSVFDPDGSWNNYTYINKYNYTCEGVATITVSAGTFDTYVINRTAWGDTLNYTLYYYAEAAGNIVKMYAYNGYGNQSEILSGELASYYYAVAIPELTLFTPLIAGLAIVSAIVVYKKRR